MTRLPFAIMIVLAACDGSAGVAIDAAPGRADAGAIDAAANDAAPAVDASPIADAPLAIDASTPIDAPPLALPLTVRLGDGREGHVAMNAAGDAAAVWCLGDQVVARRYVKDVGWQPQAQLDAAHCWQTSIAITPAGDAIALWISLDAGVWSARYSAGAGWSAPVQLDPAASTYPLVGVDATGDAIALWVGSTSTGSTLTARRYVSGDWTPSVLVVETPATTSLADLRLGFDAAGTTLALWRTSIASPTADEEQLWSRRFVPATGWGPMQQIPGHTGAIVAENLVVRPDGSAYAVWKYIGGPTGPAWDEESTYTPGAGWSAMAVMQGGQGAEPTATLDASGRVIVAWNGGNDVDHARRLTATGAEDGVIGPGGFAPRFAPLGSQELTLGWIQTSTFQQLWARRFTWGSWGTPVRLDAIDGEIDGWQVVASPAGNGSLAIWTQSDGPVIEHLTTWGVWATVW